LIENGGVTHNFESGPSKDNLKPIFDDLVVLNIKKNVCVEKTPPFLC
jgi:hypothetical protein